MLVNVQTKHDGPIELNGNGGGMNGDVTERKVMESLSFSPLSAVPHNYCFMTGRHGEFLYLKLGAACKYFYTICIFTERSLFFILFIQSGMSIYIFRFYTTLLYVIP